MTVLVRELRPTVRNPFSVIFSMVQPLFFLSLFGPLLIADLRRAARPTPCRPSSPGSW